MQVKLKNISGQELEDFSFDNSKVLDYKKHLEFFKNFLFYIRTKQSRIKTAHAKVRSEIAGSTKKVLRQKGSGHARRSTPKVSQFRSGAKVHGPRYHIVGFKVNKKYNLLMRKILLSYLFDKNKIAVVDNCEIESQKTKNSQAILKAFDCQSAMLIHNDEIQDKHLISARNLKNKSLKYSSVNRIFFYELFKSDFVIFTKASLEQFVKTL